MDSTQINSEQRRKRWLRGRSGRGLAAAIVVLAAWDVASSLVWEPGTPRLAAGLFVRAAYAQDFAAAGQHFASAQDAFAQGQFELAAKEFQAAYDITRDPAMLLSIGESWQRGGDGKKALAGYRAYLAAQPQAPDRAEVESRIAAIEAALANPPPAATPAAAGAPATGTAGAATPAGAPGPVGAPTPPAKPGSDAASPASPASPTTTPGAPGAAGGQPGDAAKAAAAPPAPAKDAVKADAAGPPPVTPPERPASRLRTAGWVTVAVAIALATSGAIVGLGAQDRADELRRRTTVLIGNQPPVYDAGQAEAYTTLRSEGTAYNQAAIALLSTAGAVAVTAGVLFIVDYVRRPKAETKTKGGWALGPWLGPGAQGVGGRAGAGAVSGGLVASGSF